MEDHESLRGKLFYTVRVERAVRLVWDSGRTWTMVGAVLVVLQGVLPLASLYLMKLIVDTVSIGLEADTEVAYRQVLWYIILAGLVSLIGAGLSSVADVVRQEQSERVVDHVQSIIHAKSVEADLEYYENSEYHDTLQRAQAEAISRPYQIVEGLMAIGQSGITMFAMAGLLFTFHWAIMGVLVVAVVPGIIVRMVFAGRMFEWQNKRTSTERRADYYDFLLTGAEFAKEVRLFDLGSVFIGRFRDLRRNLRREKLTINARRSLFEFVAQGSATVAVFGSYAFIAYRTVQGVISVGDLVMLFQAMRQGQGALREMLSGVAGLYEDNLFLTNLYQFLDLEKKVMEPERPESVPRPYLDGIVLDHVGFSYPSSTRQALSDISMVIKPGEHVALVGENGSGKTTLVKLLCRLYDPTDGSVAIDGVDLRAINSVDWRKEMSVVFQDYAQYDMTAKENIWFGNVAQEPDQDRIERASRQADADEIISQLPSGYDTVLGYLFEEGEQLSIGQWQKIALARAFLRESQIIVLDEPTSALDPRAEFRVFEKFHELTKGRTAVLVSHRLSTVRMVDRVYVMDQGSICESGSHEELMAQGGLYKQLFETQAHYYR
ncbi:MAG: ABC transporter ATP-binding protein [Candidatus Latescibacteria bacterium]|jgi:ATP-binding cassette, subfamily B, bacterial|nr:ABC transporter ATP-binding protein [Candidatus Latescibacterota bacterium]